MFDPVQVEYDILGMLKSCSRLDAVNVVAQRPMVLQSMVDEATIYSTKRNGRTGAGLLVEIAAADCRRPNVSGPVLNWVFGVCCLENPAINMHAQVGTGLTAEHLAQIVLDVVHLHADSRLGTFECSASAVKPTEREEYPGTVGYRVRFEIIGKSRQTPRCSMPTLAYDATAGVVSLACGTAGARIFFTTDGSFPASENGGNPQSTLYTSPFAVGSGDKVRAVAYADETNNSAAQYFAVP